MKSRVLVAGLALMLAVPLLSAHSRHPRFGVPVPADAGSTFTPDKGKLRILQGGAEAGSEQFELEPSGNGWIARGNTLLHLPGGGEVRATSLLRLSADGSPLHYEWTAQGQKKASGTVDFKNGTAKTEINLGGKNPLQEDFKFRSPRVAILDNNLYDQYALLARLYDWNAKGTQTFSVLIPQDMTPGSIAVESLGTKTIDGHSLEALRVHTADIDVQVYFDAQHRLMRIEVPAANVVIVRE
jgi:hypothetical protein